MINNAPNKSPTFTPNAPPSSNIVPGNPSQNAPPTTNNPFGGQSYQENPFLFFPNYNYGETNPPVFGLYPSLAKLNRSIDGSQNNK